MDNVDQVYQSGFRHYKQKNFENAQREFNRVLALDPTHHYALAYLAQILFELEDYHSAIPLLQRAIQTGTDRENWDLFFMLGCAYGMVEEFDKSAEALLKALHLNPKNDLIQSTLARILAKRATL